MRNDGPTVPRLGGHEPDGAADPVVFGEMPTWPPVGERPGGQGGAFGPDGSPERRGRATLLRVSLGVNAVVLMGLLGFLLLNQAGAFALGGATGPSAPGAALSNPTALPTPTATSSATPLSGWLQVTPSSVRLGCDGEQRTQVVVLANTGPEDLQWQALVAGSGDRAGIALSPTQGELEAGASVSVLLQNTTSSSGSHGGSSRQGVIRFAPNSTDAGPPASLSYTAERCH